MSPTCVPWPHPHEYISVIDITSMNCKLPISSPFLNLTLHPGCCLFPACPFIPSPRVSFPILAHLHVPPVSSLQFILVDLVRAGLTSGLKLLLLLVSRPSLHLACFPGCHHSWRLSIRDLVFLFLVQPHLQGANLRSLGPSKMDCIDTGPMQFRTVGVPMGFSFLLLNMPIVAKGWTAPECAKYLQGSLWPSVTARLSLSCGTTPASMEFTTPQCGSVSHRELSLRHQAPGTQAGWNSRGYLVQWVSCLAHTRIASQLNVPPNFEKSQAHRKAERRV